MQKSPIHPKLQAEELDPQLDFGLFLKEAKTHASDHQVKLEAVAIPHSCTGKKQLEGLGQKNKSWKKSLFSWLRAEYKKNKHMPIPEEEEEPSNSSFNNSKQRRSSAHVLSGPIRGSGGGSSRTDRPRKTSSGPLLGFFNPTKRSEDKMPYICLNSPRAAQSYGPVYMVS